MATRASRADLRRDMTAELHFLHLDNDQDTLERTQDRDREHDEREHALIRTEMKTSLDRMNATLVKIQWLLVSTSIGGAVTALFLAINLTRA